MQRLWQWHLADGSGEARTESRLSFEMFRLQDLSDGVADRRRVLPHGGQEARVQEWLRER